MKKTALRKGLLILFKERIGILILLTFFIVFIFFLYIALKKKPYATRNKNSLICPVRGLVGAKKYDKKGYPSEEYRRIWLTNFFLRKGFFKKQFVFEHAIRIGHKGRNSLKVDLIIKNLNCTKILVVVEIKKKYNEQGKNSAIKHQLLPAMQILNSKYGVYFDGSKNSCYLLRKKNNNLVIKNFF